MDMAIIRAAKISTERASFDMAVNRESQEMMVNIRRHNTNDHAAWELANRVVRRLEETSERILATAYGM